jgi:hypothetical protein
MWRGHIPAVADEPSVIVQGAPVGDPVLYQSAAAPSDMRVLVLCAAAGHLGRISTDGIFRSVTAPGISSAAGTAAAGRAARLVAPRGCNGHSRL